MLSIKMAQALGDKVRRSSPLRKISGWNREVVELRTDQGIVRFREVVAALSPSLCNQIAFNPPLPARRAELQRLWTANAPMRKTVHVCPRPFQREAGRSGQVMQVDGPMLWSADTSPPNATPGIISAFIKPESPANAIKEKEYGGYRQSSRNRNRRFRTVSLFYKCEPARLRGR